MTTYTNLLGRLNERLYPMTQTELLSILAAAGVLPGAGGRTILAAPTTFYIATTGSDSNTGLTSGSPWLTPGHAYAVLTSLYDFGGQDVTVQAAAGTYSFAGLQFTNPWSGGGTLTFQGDLVTPDNVVFNSSGLYVFLNSCTLPGVLNFYGMKITAAAGAGIRNIGIGSMQFKNLDFGLCASYHNAAAVTGAIVKAVGPYTISGGAQAHLFAGQNGFMQATANVVTITGTPAFSTAYAVALGLGNVSGNGATFIGTATGVRYNASGNALIQSGGGGPNYFPGDSVGVTSLGGVYT